MVSKNQIKLIKSLQQKKYRHKHGLFIAEGVKVITEFLYASFELYKLFTTNKNLFFANEEILHEITEAELKKISSLTTPNKAIGLFKTPVPKKIVAPDFIVALDDVRDPGNLGTIIRLCDWFGIHDIVCSNETADCYNPKAVQASMGSLARVNVVYSHLTAFLSTTRLPVFASDAKGSSVYTVKLPKKAVLVMGNEANGISKNILKIAQKTIAIPNFSRLQQAESLNVAIATAIILSEFKRKV